MTDKDYYLNLYEIASQLNKEFSLHSTLYKSLEKTLEILKVDTGWIWLTEPNNKSVYLAASHNLPPALSKYPERLSGWCYCIKQYLSDDIDQAMNISEIQCSRLKDITSGTDGLKFHATIPIIVNDQKVGLINLLSKKTQKLSQRKLTLLNTISELIGTAIQRNRFQQAFSDKNNLTTSVNNILSRVFMPKIESVISALESSAHTDKTLKAVMKNVKTLRKDLKAITIETEIIEESDTASSNFNYPETPLSKRELEVLKLIKTGFTNDQIGQQLFITERTVKFHVTSILSKLNADNRTRAVDIALKRGLFSI